MSARITISDIASHEPYYLGTQPQLIEVSGRTSRDCIRLKVTVRIAEGAGDLFSRDDVAPVFQSVPAGADSTLPEFDGAWTASFSFDPQERPYGVVRCGTELLAEAEAYDAAVGGIGTARLPVRCKGVQDAGTDPNIDVTGWPWPWPPDIMCRGLRWAYGIALISAFAIFAMAACFTTTGWFIAAAVGFTAAMAALILWRNWCVPTACEVWGVVCWAAKNSAIYAFAVATLWTCGTGFIGVALLGGVAAMAIAKLDEYRCPIPSAGNWPY